LTTFDGTQDLRGSVPLLGIFASRQSGESASAGARHLVVREIAKNPGSFIAV